MMQLSAHLQMMTLKRGGVEMLPSRRAAGVPTTIAGK